MPGTTLQGARTYCYSLIFLLLKTPLAQFALISVGVVCLEYIDKGVVCFNDGFALLVFVA